MRGITLQEALRLVARCEAVRRGLHENGFVQVEFSFVDALQTTLDEPSRAVKALALGAAVALGSDDAPHVDGSS